eukprot:gene7351-7278_t
MPFPGDMQPPDALHAARRRGEAVEWSAGSEAGGR